MIEYEDCRLLNEMKQSPLGLMLEGAVRSEGSSLCDGCCYSISECPHSKYIKVGLDRFRILNSSKEDIKKYKDCAYCMECKKNTAKPVCLVDFQGRPGIVLKCNKCRNTYVVVLDRYKHEYAGFINGYGDFIPGMKYGGMPENLKRKYELRREDRDREFMLRLGISNEQLESMRRQRVNDNREFWAKEKRRLEEREAKLVDEKIEKDSRTRKELIAAGVLKFDKASRCLYDTRTGEIISKL